MKKVKLGVVGVDSGQLMICDPSYINSEWTNEDSGYSDHAHKVYRHKDGSLWQFTYGEKSSVKNVNIFPGSYDTAIPRYRKSPNQLKRNGEFEATEINPTPHIKEGEFSYKGVCQITSGKNQGGQLNYLLGHPGVAVAFNSGLGDGTYEVYAELEDLEGWGERVKRVIIELVPDNYDEEE